MTVRTYFSLFWLYAFSIWWICHILSKLMSSFVLALIKEEGDDTLLGYLMRTCLYPRSLNRLFQKQYYWVLRDPMATATCLDAFQPVSIKTNLVINKRLRFANVFTKCSILKWCTLEAIFLGQHMPLLNDEAPKYGVITWFIHNTILLS